MISYYSKWRWYPLYGFLHTVLLGIQWISKIYMGQTNIWTFYQKIYIWTFQITFYSQTFITYHKFTIQYKLFSIYTSSEPKIHTIPTHTTNSFETFSKKIKNKNGTKTNQGDVFLVSPNLGIEFPTIGSSSAVRLVFNNQNRQRAKMLRSVEISGAQRY